MARFSPLPPLSHQVVASRYASLEQQIKKSSTLRIACAGREQCGKDYFIERKTFPCLALEFVYQGSGSLETDGQHFPLYPGMLFCYGPHSPYQMKSNPILPMMKYFVDFYGDEAKSLFAKGVIRPGQVLQTLDTEDFQFLFDRLIHDGTKLNQQTSEICLQYLKIILLKTCQAIKPVSSRISSSTSRFSHCRKFIDENYLHLKNLQDITHGLHLSTVHLCRLFHQFNQPSPYQYLIHKKMNRAVELLIGGGLSVKNVAAELGYDDPYHFSRLFKQHFGHSPKNFVTLSWRTK